MKIVDVTEFWSERGGGVRSYLSEKARMMPLLGAEHRVLAPGPRDEESTLEQGSACRSQLVRFKGPALPYDPTYHLFARLGAVRRRVQRELPDVLEIHSPQLAALGALSVARESFRVRTLVWHSDFIDTYLFPTLRRRSSERTAELLSEPLWAWVRNIANRCSTTLVASAWQARKLRFHGVPRVTELPFGVDKRVFRPEARDAAFRARFLGERDVPLLVSVGRLAREKRVDVALEGFRRFRAEREAVLLVLGDGPERARLEAQARDIPDVIFLGFERDRSRLACALGSADLLVHAGPFETFGLVVAEAIACATPVVATAAGAASEHAPASCSERYAADDPAALAAAMARLFARNPAQLASRVREAATQVVSVEQHFGALLGLYGELLAAA